MCFSCCTKKKTPKSQQLSTNEGPKVQTSFPFEEYEKIVKPFNCFVEFQMKDNEVIFHAKKNKFPHFTIVPSSKPSMVDITWVCPVGESRLNTMTWAADKNLDKQDGLIDVALRWFHSYFQTSKCVCDTIDFLFDYDLKKNPEFIWTHQIFTMEKVNSIFKLSIMGNGSAEPLVLPIPESFYNKFTKLEILEIYSDAKVTESCLLSLKCHEIYFLYVHLPEESIYAFIKKWVDGKSANPDFETLRFPATKHKDSIVKNIKKHVDVAILWEDDETTATIAGKVFMKREKDKQKDQPDSPIRDVIKFDKKSTFQFVQKKTDNAKKPVTATLSFKDGEGQFVVCGILDFDMDIKKNPGGRTMNYAQRASHTMPSHPDTIKLD